jgi:hypothetical protein
LTVNGNVAKDRRPAASRKILCRAVSSSNVAIVHASVSIDSGYLGGPLATTPALLNCCTRIGSLPYYQDRAPDLLNDFLGVASEQKVLPAGVSVRGDNHEIS